MELSTRELALLAWICIVVMALLLSTKLRPPLFAIARAMLHPKIVEVVGLAALYTAGCVWLLALVGLWRWDNLKTTIVWFVATAVVAMASSKELEKGASALWALVREAITITAIVLFLGSIKPLPFWAEFLLLPLLTVITAMVAVAERQPKHRIVIAPLNGILAVAGLSIIGYSIYRVVVDWRNFDAALQVREFVIPIALTVMFLPYLYSLILFMGFESAAIRLKFKVEDRALRRYIWLHGILAFGASSPKFLRFIHAIQMSEVTDHAGVKSILAKLRQSMRREKAPPPVDWAEGWPPYAAITFLADHGLRARHYHPSVGGWSADSPYLKLGDGVLPDHLVYRISGTETAATELTLELNARISNGGDPADNAFWVAASTLIQQALSDEAELRFSRATSTDVNVLLDVDGVQVLLERDAWQLPKDSGYGRTLTIRRPAYRDPFAPSYVMSAFLTSEGRRGSRLMAWTCSCTVLPMLSQSVWLPA